MQPDPPTVEIPLHIQGDSLGQKSLKTPADEGIAFFESLRSPGEEPVRVFELQLDPDGGPSKDKAVRILLTS